VVLGGYLGSMVLVSWDRFTEGLSHQDVELLDLFRNAAMAFDGVTERVHRTEVQYVRTRIFAAGFVRSHRLEIAVDLLRRAEHPLLRSSFPTTQQVLTHRLKISSIGEFDASVLALLQEAHETVGSGSRPTP
jgi:uncharacterized protein DUF5655